MVTARRAWAIRRAAEIPAPVVLHRLGASVERASAQAAQRARDQAVYAHLISQQDNEHLASIMEPPSEEEGFLIIDV